VRIIRGIKIISVSNRYLNLCEGGVGRLEKENLKMRNSSKKFEVEMRKYFQKIKWHAFGKSFCFKKLFQEILLWNFSNFFPPNVLKSSFRTKISFPQKSLLFLTATLNPLSAKEFHHFS